MPESHYVLEFSFFVVTCCAFPKKLTTKFIHNSISQASNKQLSTMETTATTTKKTKTLVTPQHITAIATTTTTNFINQC